ncbi:hypothetical protein [Rhodanobacter sp. BL-MT-08]
MRIDIDGIAAMLDHQAGEGADTEKIAAIALSTWEHAEEALSPIIGKQSVTALYKRSLQKNLVNHPCLVIAYGPSSGDESEFYGFVSALSGQTPERASAALLAAFTTFYELLTHLLGRSLLEQLMKPCRYD